MEIWVNEMIPTEMFQDYKDKGIRIGIGVPFEGLGLVTRKIFWHYGKILRVYPTAITLQTNSGTRVIEIGHILEIKEER